MAEAVGLVGSIISIVTLASQIVKGVVVLKDFVDAARDAPDDIVITLNALEDLALTVADFDRDFPPELVGSRIARHRARCIESCQQAIKVLESLLNELELQVGKRRLLGGVRMVLKKPTIEKIKDRLRDAQMALLMSNQIYFEAIKEQRTLQLYQIAEQTLETIQEMKTRFQDQPQAVTRRTNSRLPPARESNDNQKALTVGARYSKSYRFRIPEWLRLPIQHIEFTAWTSTYRPGWILPDRSYQLHADGSDVHNYLKQSNVESLRELLCTRRVTPFDLIDGNPRRSLFQLAIIYGSTKVCHLLLDMGFKYEWSSTSSVPVDMFNEMILDLSRVSAHSFYSLGTLEAQHSEIPKLITRIMDGLSWISYGEDDVWMLRSDSFPVFRQLTETVGSSYDALPIDTCITHIFRLRAYDCDDFVATTHFILKDRMAEPEISEALHLEHGTILQCVVFFLARAQAVVTLAEFKKPLTLWYEEDPKAYEIWSVHMRDTLQLSKNVATELIQSGTDVNAFAHETGLTILIEIIAGAMREWCDCQRGFWFFSELTRRHQLPLLERTIRTAVVEWLNILRECGIDLRAYGRREKQLKAKGKVDCDIYFAEDDLDRNIILPYAGIRLIGFTYGPQPEDWSFFFTPIWQDWFVEFWDMVDHPERAMPGAWDWEQEQLDVSIEPRREIRDENSEDEGD